MRKVKRTQRWDRRWQHNSDYLQIRDTAPSDVDAGKMGLELWGNPPRGYHPWTLKLQRSSHGRACSVLMEYRKTRAPGGVQD